MPFSRLFRSRWAALAWAAGILWMAHDATTPSEPEAADPAALLSAAAAGR